LSKTKDFAGTLNTSKISINDTDYHNKKNNKIVIKNNFDNQKQELLELHKSINEVSDNRSLKIEGELPDDTIDLSDILGVPSDPANGSPATGL